MRNDKPDCICGFDHVQNVHSFQIENTDGEVEILEKELASFAKGMECFVKDIKEEH